MATKVSLNDPRARQALREVESISAGAADQEETLPPSPAPPVDTIFELDGGYRSLKSGEWVNKFEVRELDGYDEEAISRIKDPGKFIIALIERGLVRVGDESVNDDLLDGLLAGDWDTILLAIRIATFGEEMDQRTKCDSCGSGYTITVNLRDDITHQTLDPEDHVFEVSGRRGASYRVTAVNGAVQRAVLTSPDRSGAEMTTALLRECVLEIKGRPVLGEDSVRSIPMADRQRIMREIDARRVGPDLRGVMTKCPTCGNEQRTSLNAAALFQGE